MPKKFPKFRSAQIQKRRHPKQKRGVGQLFHEEAKESIFPRKFTVRTLFFKDIKILELMHEFSAENSWSGKQYLE